VLLSGAVLCAVAVSTRLAPTFTLAFGALLAFMSADEWFGVHEHLEDALHVDWPLLYLPLMTAGGVVALLLVSRYRAVPWLPHAFLGGGGCWATAVVLEKLQWTEAGHGPHYVAMMIPEELLEATGSFRFSEGLAQLNRAAARAPLEAA
jgi:hypothetical protein